MRLGGILLFDNLNTKIAISRAKEGKGEGFSFLYDKYADTLFRFAFIKLPTKEDAENLVQDAFMKTFANIKTMKNSNFKAFLFAVARNLVADFYRSRASRVETVEMESISNTKVASVEIFETETIVESEAKQKLQKLLGSLNKKEREILELRYILELNVRETAKEMKISESNVKVIAHRAKKKLEQLNEESER